MIIVVAELFDVYKNGVKTGVQEFVASHGVDTVTGRDVVLQCVHPAQLGARFDQELQEWVIS